MNFFTCNERYEAHAKFRKREISVKSLRKKPRTEKKEIWWRETDGGTGVRSLSSSIATDQTGFTIVGSKKYRDNERGRAFVTAILNLPLPSYFCSSLRSIQQRGVFYAGRRQSGLLWHASLVQQHLPDALRHPMVSWKGKSTMIL